MARLYFYVKRQLMSTSQLHITNGDCAAEIIKASSLGGDVLPWRDPMHHVPLSTRGSYNNRIIQNSEAIIDRYG